MWRNLAQKWKITAIVLGAIVLAVGITCLVAGIKAGNEEITFFESLAQLFGSTGEVVEDVIENGDIVEDVVETAASII